MTKTEQDDIFPKFFQRFDPRGVIQNVNELRPLTRDEIVDKFFKYLKEKQPEITLESLTSYDRVSRPLHLFLRDNQINIDSSPIADQIIEVLDPDCVKIPRGVLIHPLFLSRDADSLGTNYESPKDQVSQAYLKVMSELAKTNIKKVLPINPKNLEGHSLDSFSYNFRQSLERTLEGQNLGEQEYNQLALNVVSKLGPIKPEMAKKLMVYHVIPKTQFQALTYKDQVQYLCQKLVKNLELADSSVSPEDQLEEIDTKLGSVLRNKLEIDDLQVINFMIEDVSHFIYPEHSPLPTEERPKSCPKIEGTIEVFPKEPENVQSVTSIGTNHRTPSTPNANPGKTTRL